MQHLLKGICRWLHGCCSTSAQVLYTPTPLPPPPPVQKHVGMRARAMQMKRQFNRVLLILVRTWMILIITRSSSLIGPFSKSTFARAALMDHSVDMLQAYIGIKYLCTELWRCLSCQTGCGGEKNMPCPVKKKLLHLFDEHGTAYLSVYGSTVIRFFLRWVSKCNVKFIFLFFPLERRKVKILSSSWRA